MDYTCKNCGNVFGEHLAVCPSCGTPVEAVPQTENTASTEPEVQAQQQPDQEQPGVGEVAHTPVGWSGLGIQVHHLWPSLF